MKKLFLAIILVCPAVYADLPALTKRPPDNPQDLALDAMHNFDGLDINRNAKAMLIGSFPSRPPNPPTARPPISRPPVVRPPISRPSFPSRPPIARPPYTRPPFSPQPPYRHPGSGWGWGWGSRPGWHTHYRGCGHWGWGGDYWWGYHSHYPGCGHRGWDRDDGYYDSPRPPHQPPGHDDGHRTPPAPKHAGILTTAGAVLGALSGVGLGIAIPVLGVLIPIIGFGMAGAIVGYLIAALIE